MAILPDNCHPSSYGYRTPLMSKVISFESYCADTQGQTERHSRQIAAYGTATEVVNDGASGGRVSDDAAERMRGGCQRRRLQTRRYDSADVTAPTYSPPPAARDDDRRTSSAAVSSARDPRSSRSSSSRHSGSESPEVVAKDCK